MSFIRAILCARGHAMIHIAITNDISYLGCRLLIQLIQFCGGLPILIPCFLPINDVPRKISLQHHLVRVERLLEDCKAVIIPGNHFDINPKIYGEEVHPETEKFLCKDPYNVRFETELLMARHALNNDLPFIGICGGMHIMNVVLGGKLVQHLPDVDAEHTDRISHYDRSWSKIYTEKQPKWERSYLSHLQTNKPPAMPFTDSHNLQVEHDSILGKLYKDLDNVCELSMHHQGCFAEQLSDCLQPIAYAPDGVVEAAQLKGYATMGILTQYHFEYNVGGIAHQLVRMLVACAQ